MAIRFIRQPSDTPNVTNSDDARMVRYAYGGYDGFVLNRGSELSHTINGNIFKINSGVVVLQGYESELDSNGWELDVGSDSRYYSVYYEVNLATQTTAIKSVYNLSSYPDIPASDDLTQSANGIACLLLYQFRVMNNGITDVVKKVKAIPYFGIGYENGTLIAKIAEYASQDFSKGTIEERLNKLGFKSGTVSLTEGKSSENYVYRQGNFVYGRVVVGSMFTTTVGKTIFTLPVNFRPKNQFSFNAGMRVAIVSFSGSQVTTDYDYYTYVITFNTDGTVVVTNKLSNGKDGIINGYSMQFGFETNAI